jgi:predicted secreted protein
MTFPESRNCVGARSAAPADPTMNRPIIQTTLLGTMTKDLLVKVLRMLTASLDPLYPLVRRVIKVDSMLKYRVLSDG